MYRLLPGLATLAMITLPACKRGKDDTNDPGSDSGVYVESESSTPTPEQVCTRLSQLAVADLGAIDPAIQQETIAMCTTEMAAEQQSRGPEGWDGVARCVLAAQNDADIDRCDQLYPPPGGGAPPAPVAEGGTKEDQVCVIMISIFAIELMAEAEATGQPAPELADDDIREAHAECLGSLEGARQSRTGAEYDALLDCLANADSTPTMDACLAGG
ncbi:hypothetical protein ACNOYE_26145 [Nannocystaceae bacterium ST9]